MDKRPKRLKTLKTKDLKYKRPIRKKSFAGRVFVDNAIFFLEIYYNIKA